MNKLKTKTSYKHDSEDSNCHIYMYKNQIYKEAF